eukprot:PhF_6_TR32407/c0_g1_i1/m.48079/K12844/PRPF31; U4/U6 small nuclear ribonucleoprotein PRP31
MITEFVDVKSKCEELLQHPTLLQLIAPSNSTTEYPSVSQIANLFVEIKVAKTRLFRFIKSAYISNIVGLDEIQQPDIFVKIVKLLGKDLSMSDLQNSNLDRSILQRIMINQDRSRLIANLAPRWTDIENAIMLYEALQGSDERLQTELSVNAALLYPNLSALLGPEISGVVVALAGDIKQLAAMDPKRIQMLGREKTELGDRSTVTLIYGGVLQEVKWLRDVVPFDATDSDMIKVARNSVHYCAQKAALAARKDLNKGEDNSNTYGLSLKDEIQHRLVEQMEPPEERDEKKRAKPNPKEHKQQRGGWKKRLQNQRDAVFQDNIRSVDKSYNNDDIDG